MDVLFTPTNLAALLIGYLIGSIPFGLLLTKAAGLGDIRNIGSGNIGATNVLRTGNKSLAALTLFLDMLKGTLATVVAYLIAQSFTIPAAPSNISMSVFPWMTVCIGGLGAFIGHLFPVWLGFKGGKGVATYIGVLLLIAWPVAAAFCFAWLITAAATRFSSLAALIASLSSVAVAMYLGPPHVSALCAFMTAFMIVKHRNNIERLLQGEEPKNRWSQKNQFVSPCFQLPHHFR